MAEEKKANTDAKKEKKEVKAKPAESKKTANAKPAQPKAGALPAKPAPQAGGKGKKSIEEIEAELMGLSILKYPLITEKAVNMIEAENKLVFVVDRNATKTSIRRAVETVYKVKVNKVNIVRDMKARKKALVSIDKKFKADDIATKLGVI